MSATTARFDHILLFMGYNRRRFDVPESKEEVIFLVKNDRTYTKCIKFPLNITKTRLFKYIEHFTAKKNFFFR